MDAALAAESVARRAYGRLLAILAAPTGDIPAAEDALADAFLAALRTWPLDGVPRNPEGWLMTAARNRLKDRYKSAAYSTADLDDSKLLESALSDAAPEVDMDAIADKRLALMFVCAHPAIDPGIRSALMLQAVLGFESEQIARAFAVPAPAMAQRLVRAKRRIKNLHIRFEVPDQHDMPARLPAVLEAVYGAVAIDREHDEALFLALTIADALDDPEALGLAALLSFVAARAPARPAPLDDQDTGQWNPILIAQGERLLRRARGHRATGRFQLEAAIQSVHCDRARTGLTNYPALRTLYTGLVRIAPTLGARVSLAAVVGEIDGPAAGLAVLDELGSDIRLFQPAWAVRAHLLATLDVPTAREAYDEAILLSVDPEDRRTLTERRALLD